MNVIEEMSFVETDQIRKCPWLFKCYMKYCHQQICN